MHEPARARLAERRPRRARVPSPAGPTLADVLALAGAGQSGCAEDDAGALDPKLGTAVPEIRGEEHLDDPCSGTRDPASSEDLPAYAGQEVTLPAEVTEVLSPRVSTVTSPDDAEVGEVLMTATEEAGDVEPQADEALVVAATAVDSLEAGGVTEEFPLDVDEAQLGVGRADVPARRGARARSLTPARTPLPVPTYLPLDRRLSMTTRSAPPSARTRLVATATGVLLALTGCSDTEEAPLSDAPAEVEGGAVGPDARLNDDVGLQQVQLEYPLDGVYEAGEDARLFMSVTNTGGQPVTLTDISGPDFGGVRVETTEGQGLPLTVDAEDNLYVGAEGPPEVTLSDLGRELRSSQSIPVTFTFAEAGEVTIDVPVSAEGQTPTPPFDFPDDDPDQDPTEDDTATPSPTS